jgi:predicted DNA-binding transcriptional regulator YafY
MRLMQASRLLSILMLLQARGRMTAGALAEAMEVSERTILRDVDRLSAAGVPLWGERGRQGGFQLREGWSTQLTGMTEPEAHALLLAGLPGPATELGLGAAAASARLKMVASLPSGWREQADRVGQRLHIDPVDWYRAQDAPKFLREVADAVWRARRIEVRYESWKGEALRVLEPLGLVLKAGAWYLVARPALATVKPAEVRTYRLASLIGLRDLAQGFKRPKTFDLARTWQASATRFETELRQLEVRARVSARCLKWLANARIPYAQAADGEVVFHVESVEQGARQLLGFGPEIEVLAPPALRARLLQQAAAVAAMYPARRA